MAQLLSHVLASAMLTTLTFAQTGQPAPPADLIRTGNQGVFRCDEQWVGIGDRYKVHFDAHGFDFVPTLGKAAAHDVPLRLEAVRVRRHGAALRLNAVPPEELGDNAVRYARAAGVDELLETRHEGLEQSFVFAHRPEGTGDLVVCCNLVCEVPGRTTDGGGLSFDIEGVGAITIGAVTGIDASGSRITGSIHLAGGTLELSLPGDFVDRASYPLVLDPLLSTATLLSGIDRTEPDVVFDPATGDWLAVWTVQVSATDRDIYGQRVSQATGSPVSGAFPIDVGQGDTAEAQLASVRLTGRALVVYRSFALLGNSLLCRSVDVGARTASTVASIGSGYNHAVASDETLADDEALVVYATNSNDVEGVQVTVPASGPPVRLAPVTLATNLYAASCSISRTGGGNGTYLVAWKENSGLPFPATQYPVYGCAVSRNMVILTPAHLLVPAAVGKPAIDASGSRFLLAYALREPGSTPPYSLHDIYSVSVAYLAAFSSLIVTDGPSPVEATPNQDELLPDVAWLGQRFCVTFTENYGASNENVGARLVNPDCSLCSTRMALAGVNLNPGYVQEREARVSSRAPWLSGVDDGEVVFLEDNPSAPHPLVIGQRVEAIGPGGAIVDLGGGCGPGGVAGSSGSFALGNDAFAFTVSGLPPGALTFLALALPVPALSCGSCTLINPASLEFKPAIAGAATSPFTLPCAVGYFGLPIQAQWMSLLTNSTVCPQAPGLAATNRLQFTIGN
jgi:hypothetical protein